jgi:hypothetical protein
MRPLDIVRLPKTVVDAGDWKVTTGVSRMPATAYPMSRRASFQLGRGWHWRIDILAADGFTFRLMTAFSGDKEEFLAWLSIQAGEGLRVVARYEFHGDHPGWHYHTAECDHDELPIGDPRPRAFSRTEENNDGFGLSEKEALGKSFKFFNVTVRPEDAMI